MSRRSAKDSVQYVTVTLDVSDRIGITANFVLTPAEDIVTVRVDAPAAGTRSL